MAVGEDPPKQLNPGALTPAVGVAFASNCAHSLNKPADQSEQHVQPCQPAKPSSHARKATPSPLPGPWPGCGIAPLTGFAVRVIQLVVDLNEPEKAE